MWCASSGDIGIWHETYLIRAGEYETVYGSMPRVGLARAFLSAGAGRVMATLWPVQDRASATLMERFYERYRVGTEPAKALAAAQRALLGNPATASPYYWAGFEVVGGR